jgi:hypothetical protein
MNAIATDILVRMVDTVSATMPIPIRHHNLTTSDNAQRGTLPIADRSAATAPLRADASVPTSEQRRAARAIADGKIGTLRADVLEALMRWELLMYDGQSLVLTDVGRALAALQPRSASH